MKSRATVSLKPFETKHLERTRMWTNDADLATLVGRTRPINDQEHREWFASLHKSTTNVHFAVETSEEEHIGHIWLHDIDTLHRRAEIRVVIGETAATGHGYGTEAISLIRDYAFQRLNLHKVYAYVVSINPRARRAFEKAGFELEGTLKQDRWSINRYIDVYLLAALRPDPELQHGDLISTAQKAVSR
jgi:RimJ/RimL family protein N-acetyltransferase